MRAAAGQIGWEWNNAYQPRAEGILINNEDLTLRVHPKKGLSGFALKQYRLTGMNSYFIIHTNVHLEVHP